MGCVHNVHKADKIRQNTNIIHQVSQNKCQAQSQLQLSLSELYIILFRTNQPAKQPNLIYNYEKKH